MPVPTRVLLIASDRFDTVGDSYRRMLAPHYQVKLVSPEAPRSLPLWAAKGMALLGRSVLGEPMGFSLPMLERTARAFQPEIVLVSQIQAIPPRVIEAIRKSAPDVRIVGVFSDHLANFERGYFFAAAYDALFFKDRYIVDKLRTKLGFKHVWYLPQACDPELHFEVALTPEDHDRYGCDITLAGNLYYYRAAALEPLLDRGWSVRLWGEEPPRWFEHPVERWVQHRPVMGLDKCRAMRAARIVVNQNHYAEIAGTNKRTFEVAAMGAFQLTDTPALADVFEPGIEVACFDSQTDMLDKIEHYLGCPGERQAMAERAQARAHREHTYAHRWAAKMQVLGLPLPPEFPLAGAELAVRAR